MRIVLFIKTTRPLVGQIFINGVLSSIDSLDEYDGWYGGYWIEDGEYKAFIIPNIPDDKVIVKEKHLSFIVPRIR